MRVKLLLVTDIKQTDLADYDQSKAKDFELETNQSPDDNVKRAVDLYNLPEPPTHYALQVADSKEKEYLVDSDDVQGVNENSLLILKVSPVERVEACINDINEGNPAKLKQTFFDMRYLVKDAGFAEEFIDRDGIVLLLSILHKLEDKFSTTKGYALTALRCCMGYLNGLNKFLAAPELVIQLFELVRAKLVTIARQAVELLFVLCNYDGWNLVYNAATTFYSSRSELPFQDIILMLDQNDLDTRLNALTFLNSILENAPDRELVKKLIFEWRDNFQLVDIIHKQKKVQDQTFKTQLDIFYTNTAEYLEAPTLGHADQIAEFQAQQPLLQLLVSELANCHQIIQAAQNAGTPISAKAPTQRFERQRGWQSVDRPVDLTFLTNKSRLVLDTGRQRRPTFGSAAAAFGSESDINLLVEGRQQRPMAGLSKSVGSEEERFKAEIKTIKEQLDTKSQQLLTFEEKMEKYRKLENELNEKIQSLQSQLEKARSENVMVASTPVPSIESEKVAAGDDKLLQEQQKRIDSLLSEKIKLETDIAQLTQKINELSSSNNKLIQELNQYKSHVESLSSKLSAIAKGEMTEDEIKAAAEANIAANAELSGPSVPPQQGGEGGENGEGGAPPPPAPPLPGMGGPPPPPPLPGMGGPPPPPPLPGGPPPPPGMGPPPLPGMAPPLANQPTKPKITPKNKLKPLFWKRILNNGGESSFWSDITELAFDPTELEDNFAVKATEKPLEDSQGAGGSSADNKKKVIRLLDQKRSNAIGIMINSMPNVKDLVNAILEMNERVVKRDSISMLLQNLPTSEEVELIKSTKVEDGAFLDKPEVFCLEIAKIDKLAERLKCWTFKFNAPEKINDLLPPLEQIHAACTELQKSSNLKKFFGLILAVGNYLNGGSARGQADGFQIEVLPKINDTRSNNGDTLLMYLIKYCQSKFPELMSLPSEIPTSNECMKYSMNDLESGTKRLQSDIKVFEDNMNKVLPICGASEVFPNIMSEFLSETKHQAEQIQKKFEITSKLFAETVKYFGNRSPMGSDEFFQIFGRFNDQFQNCVDKINSDLLIGQKKGKRSTMVKRENAGKKIGGGDGGDDPMMGIIAAIRAGKSSGLKKMEDGGTPKTNEKANNEEPQGFKFALKKVERPAAPAKIEEQPLSELQKKLLKRTNE